MKLEYIVNKNDNYVSIKQILKEVFNLSDRLIIKLKKTHNIYINNKSVNIYETIKVNDSIMVNIDFEEESSNIIPTKMELNILYEDEYLLILDKPAGIAVHPSCRHFYTSLSNGVKFYFNNINLKKKIRPVNRIDKDTTGIVIFAKNEYIQECLIKQMKNGIFKKKYIALISGILENKTGTINAPISRKENSIIERCINENGDNAITHYKVLKEFTNYSLVSFILETGRTHQIRLHCKHIGHPIIGDTLYGTSSSLINRQALHSYKVTFNHPVTNREIKIISELPVDIKNLI